MATAITANAPQYVQQAFEWNETEILPVVPKTTNADAPAIGQSRFQRDDRPLTVPTFSTSTSARRGRCEHVGGILASVLERYGLGIDQLIAEIDGLK